MNNAHTHHWMIAATASHKRFPASCSCGESTSFPVLDTSWIDKYATMER